MADDRKRDSAPREPRNRFNLALVPAVSAALLAFGCGPSPQKSSSPTPSLASCVDAQGNPLPPGACNPPTTSRSPASRTHFHTWYSVGGTAGFGTGIRGGVSSTAHGHITRGGFGSSAHASSSSHAGS